MAKLWILLAIWAFYEPVAWSAPKPPYGPIARIQSKEINESSGIVASRRHPGIFWTHNDSGDRARIFAIRADGSLVATFEVEGAKAVDWEDIAMDREGFLFIADTGNNNLNRTDLTIYKVAEPESLEAPQKPLKILERISVAYAEGAFDCEALCFNAHNQPMLITKYPRPGAIYVLQDHQWERTQVLSLVAGFVTGADRHSDGRLALSTYEGVYLLGQTSKGAWQIEQHILSTMKQCEAVCWTGEDLLMTNEQRELYRLNPKHFAQEDVYLPTTHVWTPLTSLVATLVSDQDKPTPFHVKVSALNNGDGHIQLHLEPGKNEKGALLLMFSNDNSTKRLEANTSDVCLVVEWDKTSTKSLWQQWAPDPSPPTVKVETDIQDHTLKVVIPSEFYRQQKALGVAAQIGKLKYGWPFAFRNVVARPYVWGRAP